MRTQSPYPKTSVLIAGFGEAGANIHWPACMSLPQLHVVAVVDPDDSCLGRHQIKGVPLFNNLEEGLSGTVPDLVIVASPPEFHEQQTFLSLEANAHVLCEKPISTSVLKAQKMIDAASACDRILAVNHEFRFMPIFASISRQLRQSGDEIKYASAWQNILLPPEGQSGWRAQSRNQILFDAGIHLIDFLLDVYQDSPSNVFTSITRSREGGEHLIDVTFEFNSGRLAHLSISRITRGKQEYFDARVETNTCTYRASFGGVANIMIGCDHEPKPRFRFNWGKSGQSWREVGGGREVLARNPSSPNVRATSMILEGIAAAISSGSDNPSPPQKALEALRAVAACYLSAREGRKISFNGADRALIDNYDIPCDAQTTGWNGD